MFMNVVGCGHAGTKQEFEPAAALALRADLAAANEIALRDDPDQLAGGIDHRQSADMTLQHGFRGFEDGGVRRGRDDGPGHDLMGAHVTFSCSMYQEWQNAVGWRGAADVAMLERVCSGSIDEDQTQLGRSWLGCIRLREEIGRN